MLNLKAAKVQTKKYERTVVSVNRGQDFDLKYRAYLSEQGKQKAEEAGEAFVPSLRHEFRFSNVWFDKLALADHSMCHIEFPSEENPDIIGDVALAILPEGHESATFFVQKTRKDGTKLEKNPNFTGTFLETALAEAGLIVAPKEDGDEITDEEVVGENQRLTLEYLCDVVSVDPKSKDYMEELPEGEGIAIYQVVVDDTDYEVGDDSAEEEVEDDVEVEVEA